MNGLIFDTKNACLLELDIEKKAKKIMLVCKPMGASVIYGLSPCSLIA